MLRAGLGRSRDRSGRPTALGTTACEVRDVQLPVRRPGRRSFLRVSAGIGLRTDPGGNQPEEVEESGAVMKYRRTYDGTVDRWRRAAVFTAGSRGSARFFELEPSTEPE